MQENSIAIDFRGQFRLAEAQDRQFPHWDAANFNTWVLEYCPTLTITELLDRDKCKVGCVLGYAITPDGQLLSDSLILSASIKDSTFVDSIENFISELAGRYTAFIITDLISRIYLDPAGTLSVVFSSASKQAGSSLYIVSDVSKPKIDLVKLLDIHSSNGYYPFGITPHLDVKRLRPNHFLDLSDFTEHRHWPKPGELSTRCSKDIESVVDNIARKLKRNITAVLDQYPICMSLTAGQDSRMLLATVLDRKEEVQFFTMRIPDKMARLDCQVGTILARKFHLKHRILEWQEATAHQLEAWQMRVGEAAAGRTWQAVRTRLQLDSKRVFMPGAIGEVFRGPKWKESDFSAEEISPEDIVVRRRLPDHPVFKQAADQWMRNLPLTNPFDILDVLMIEEYAGCKAGPTYYGHTNNILIAPLSDRYIFTQVMKLPAEYRFQGKLPIDLIGLYSKKLSKFPINEEVGLREDIKRTMSKCRAYVRARPWLQKTFRFFKKPFAKLMG